MIFSKKPKDFIQYALDPKYGGSVINLTKILDKANITYRENRLYKQRKTKRTKSLPSDKYWGRPQEVWNFNKSGTPHC